MHGFIFSENNDFSQMMQLQIEEWLKRKNITPKYKIIVNERYSWHCTYFVIAVVVRESWYRQSVATFVYFCNVVHFISDQHFGLLLLNSPIVPMFRCWRPEDTIAANVCGSDSRVPLVRSRHRRPWEGSEQLTLAVRWRGTHQVLPQLVWVPWIHHELHRRGIAHSLRYLVGECNCHSFNSSFF